MKRLVALNTSGELRATASFKGFHVRGQRVPGLSACLHRCAHFKVVDKTRTLSLFAPGQGSGRRLLRSNMRAGVSIHDKIRKALDASAKPLPARNFVSACARAAQAFCMANQLTHEASELVIAHPVLPLATRFDAVLKRSDGSRELVSWKTGCGPRNAAEMRQHKAQLAMERYMLEMGHGVRIDHATLLYIGVQQQIDTGALCPVFHGFDLSRAQCDQLAQAVEKHLVLKRRRRRTAAAAAAAKKK